MKRTLGIFTAVVATCALALTAVAPAAAYPPATPVVTASTSSPVAGAQVTLSARGFVAGAVVTFAIPGATLGTAVANAAGVASLAATAPSTAGTYVITASSPDGRTASLTLTVVAAGTVPATGSNSRGMSMTAGVLVLVGAGLLGATLLRRRSRAIPA